MTVNLAVRVLPLNVAVIVTVTEDVTFFVLILKEAMLVPLVTVTDDGTVTTIGSLQARDTCVFAVTFPSNITVPITVPFLPPTTEDLFSESDSRCSEITVRFAWTLFWLVAEIATVIFDHTSLDRTVKVVCI